MLTVDAERLDSLPLHADRAVTTEHVKFVDRNDANPPHRMYGVRNGVAVGSRSPPRASY